jgi:hypothetical protein
MNINTLLISVIYNSERHPLTLKIYSQLRMKSDSFCLSVSSYYNIQRELNIFVFAKSVFPHGLAASLPLGRVVSLFCESV